MRTLAFDGRMGASGDMILGALLDAGGDSDVLAPVEDALPIRYEIDTTTKNGIAATTVDVLLTDADESRRDGETDADDGDRDHGDAHDHPPHDHAEGSGPLRSYPEVVGTVEGMGLDSDVERRALRVFEILGEAEAAVHGTDIEGTHFHEVGADDAIADVVGAALLFADLAPERVVMTPLATGGGDVAMSHGHYPVPTPAVVEIAADADWSLRGGPVERELLTPTGAAILAHYAEGTATLPPLDLTGSGYGAGGYDFPERPNVLRALVGESEGTLPREGIRVLETTLDDATPEVLGGLQDSLRAVGARDVTVLPATTKKSRPGHVVQVIVKPEDAERVARRLAAETGTLGVREGSARHRWIANREIRSVAIDVEGDEFWVDVKVASDSVGEIYDVSAEYDDAAAVARETGIRVREAIRRAEAVVPDDRAS